MSQIFHLFCLRLLPCRAGAHVHTVCETQRAVLFPCSVCLQLSREKKKAGPGLRSRIIYATAFPTGQGEETADYDPVLVLCERSRSAFYLGITEYFSAQQCEMAVKS